MYIKKWLPVLGSRGVVPGHVIELSLRFEATLSCPSCSTTVEVKTRGHIFGGVIPFNLESRIKWEYEELIKQRACESCGIVSAPPKKECEELLAEATKTIIHTWIDQEIEALKPTSVVEVS